MKLDSKLARAAAESGIRRKQLETKVKEAA